MLGEKKFSISFAHIVSRQSWQQVSSCRRFGDHEFGCWLLAWMRSLMVKKKKGGLECVQCVAVSNIVIISTLPIPESLSDGKWVKCFEIINTLQPLSLFFECQRNLQSSTNLTRGIDNDTNNMRQREGDNLVGDRKWELVGLWTDGRQSH